MLEFRSSRLLYTRSKPVLATNLKDGGPNSLSFSLGRKFISYSYVFPLQS